MVIEIDRDALVAIVVALDVAINAYGPDEEDGPLETLLEVREDIRDIVDESADFPFVR